MQNIYAYIHFPKNIDTNIDTINDGQRLLKEIQMTIDLIDCEIDSTIFYSASNKNIFVQTVQICEELHNANFIGNYSFENVIDILLNVSKIEQVNEVSENDCSYLVYNSVTKETDKNSPDIFHVISQDYQKLVDSQKQILINFFNEYYVQNPISVIIDCKEKEDKMFSIPFVTGFKELDEWLQSNRKARNFNNADTRHIEGDPIYYTQRKSPLLGGIASRPIAAELLKSALGDKKRNDNVHDLVNFDEVKGEFIWYEYEGDNPQNQYHAYHLVTHEDHTIRDKKSVNKITKRILKIIEFRKKLN